MSQQLSLSPYFFCFDGAKSFAFDAQRESTGLPMLALVVVCRIRSH
jgi:hypothetical protein